MQGKSPVRHLAAPEFLRKFGDLLEPTAEWTEYEMDLIEGTYEMSFVAQYTKAEHDSINFTARLAYKILQKGAIKAFQEIVGSYLFNAERLIRSLNRAWQSRKEAFSEQPDDTMIKRILSFYKELYEGVMPVLFAPIVVSLGVSTKGKGSKYRVNAEGKASLFQLSNFQYEWTSQRKQLTIGLNNHLRNAYSHECYRIMDGRRAELWDIDPRSGNYSWGPTTLSFDEIATTCEELWRNGIGLIHAWTLFGINNRSIISKGKYDLTLPIANDPLRLGEIEELVRHVATDRGFKIDRFSFTYDRMVLALSTYHRGVDQNSDLYAGSGSTSRKFRIRMEYQEHRIIEQLLGMFQILVYQMRQEFEYDTTVFTPEKKELGIVRGHTNLFQSFAGKEKPPIDEFRKSLVADSIGDSRMWVLFESFPVEE